MINKQAIFEEARATMREWYPTLCDKPGACLYWNQAAMRSLIRHGFKPVLQAGSMHWKINRNPDPAAINTFGFQWDPYSTPSQVQIYNGLLPECHIWAALPQTGELIDFSTGSLKEYATTVFGHVWDREDPPEFIWGRPPVGTLYAPNKQAVQFVWRFLLEKQGVAA